MRRPIILLGILLAGTLFGNFGLQKVSAPRTSTVPAQTAPALTVPARTAPTLAALSDPAIFAMVGFFEGWNSSAGGVTCSPSGTANCNPALAEFRGVTFNVTVDWGDSLHDFSIYTAGTPPGSVLSSDVCSLTSTSGCLAKSVLVTSTRTSVSFSFKPTIPADDFSGVGTYEYYCQIHPFSMHGTVTIYKNPDLNGDKRIDISDVATIAFAFGSSALPSPTATWNLAADLNNDGKVSIVDVAIVAFYFDRPL